MSADVIPKIGSCQRLLVVVRIKIKINSTAPGYLTELFNVYKPTRQLRSSSDTAILCLPSVRTHSLGQRSFSYAASIVCLE